MEEIPLDCNVAAVFSLTQSVSQSLFLLFNFMASFIRHNSQWKSVAHCVGYNFSQVAVPPSFRPSFPRKPGTTEQKRGDQLISPRAQLFAQSVSQSVLRPGLDGLSEHERRRRGTLRAPAPLRRG